MTVRIELIGLGDCGQTNLLLLRLAGRLSVCIEALRDTDGARVAAAEALCR